MLYGIGKDISYFDQKLNNQKVFQRDCDLIISKLIIN